MFQLDDRELKQLLKFYKNAPKQFLAASAGMLNTFAFGVRDNAHQELKNKLTIRADGFVKSSIRVQKTRIVPLANQEAITGSVIRPRFSGWIEQETGEPGSAKYLSTKSARNHNYKNVINAKSRVHPNQEFLNIDNMQSRLKNFGKTKGRNIGRSKAQRTVAMMESLRKGYIKKGSVVKVKESGGLKYKHATYAFKRGRLFIQREFVKPAKTKKNPWMQPARDKYFKQVNLQNLWAHQINRVLKFK